MHLIIDGSPEAERFTVICDERRILMTAKSFRYLVKLALARAVDSFSNINRQGWVHKIDIEPGANQARYIYRLRLELGNRAVIENNGLGYYRLACDPTDIDINYSRLSEFPDKDITMLCLDVDCQALRDNVPTNKVLDTVVGAR